MKKRKKRGDLRMRRLLRKQLKKKERKRFNWLKKP